MSNENISFSIEIEDTREIQEREENPCFCQENILCVFCSKELEKEKEKEKMTFPFSFNEEEDENLSRKIDYSINYTVKQLSIICDYYGILKGMKRNKNKNELIEALVVFESDPNHFDIVFQRRRLWFYLEELKKDAFMKRFIFANF
jgi:hypothetical protein